MQFWGGKHFLNVEKNISLDLKLSTVANILYIQALAAITTEKQIRSLKGQNWRKSSEIEPKKKKNFVVLLYRNNNLFKFNKSLKEKTHLVSQWAKNLLKSANASSVQSYLSIFAQKYLRKFKDTYFILQNKYLPIYKDSLGAKILRDDCTPNSFIHFFAQFLAHFHIKKRNTHSQLDLLLISSHHLKISLTFLALGNIFFLTSLLSYVFI